MKNAAGILLVIYLFFLVPLLAGAFIDAAAGVKRRNISSTYANGFVAMLGIFWGVAVLFLYRGCTLEKLSMVWMLATITICVVSILANKKAILGCFKHKRKSGSVTFPIPYGSAEQPRPETENDLLHIYNKPDPP